MSQSLKFNSRKLRVLCFSGIVACWQDGGITIRGYRIEPKHTDVPWNYKQVSSGDIYQISLNADKNTVTFRHQKPETKIFENYGCFHSANIKSDTKFSFKIDFVRKNYDFVLNY